MERPCIIFEFDDESGRSNQQFKEMQEGPYAVTLMSINDETAGISSVASTMAEPSSSESNGTNSTTTSNQVDSSSAGSIDDILLMQTRLDSKSSLEDLHFDVV